MDKKMVSTMLYAYHKFHFVCMVRGLTAVDPCHLSGSNTNKIDSVTIAILIAVYAINKSIIMSNSCIIVRKVNNM